MKKKSSFFGSSPFRVVAIYAAVSFLWIYFSDTLLSAFVHDPQVVTRISVFKGFLFVLITTILLYFLIRRDMLKILQREEALRESAEKFRALFENMEDGFADCQMIFDPEGRPVDFIYHKVNSAFGRLTGLEHVIGKRVTEVLPGIRESHPELLEIYGRVARSGKPERFEIDFKPLAKWLTVSVYGTQQDHFVAVFDDITERKRSEEALRFSEQQLKSYIDHAGDAIYVIDLMSGRIMNCNEQACRDLGYSKRELLELSAKDIEVQLKPDEIDNIHHRSAAEKAMLIEGVHKKKNGSTYPVEIRLSALEPAQPKHFIAIVRDITERKKTEEIRNKLMEAKDRFTSTVSHELRTPLAAVKEATNLVLDGSLGSVNAEQEDVLNIAKENIDRLGRLINNVLIYQKMEAGRMGCDFNENDLNEVVREAYKSAALFSGSRKADLVMELGGDLPRIKFDKDKIFQVLINLMANAIKYSQSGSVILQTRREDHDIRVSVQDSGPGIEPENLEGIFEPFARFGKNQKGGTGLGLAIAKEIILSHHGRIWAESKVGKGSAFHFTLPF